MDELKFKHKLDVMVDFLKTESDYARAKICITKKGEPLLVVTDNIAVYGGIVTDFDYVKFVGEFWYHKDRETMKVELKEARVKPEYQNHGIARILMNELESYSHDLGYSKLILDSITVKVGLYEHLGFELDGTRSHKTCVPMVKDIREVHKAKEKKLAKYYTNDRKNVKTALAYSKSLQNFLDNDREL